MLREFQNQIKKTSIKASARKHIIRMMFIKKLLISAFVISSAFSYALVEDDHDHHHHDHDDHKEYAAHWGYKKHYHHGHGHGHGYHYDPLAHNDYTHVHHHGYYVDPMEVQKLHSHLHAARKQLDKINALLEDNEVNNHVQNKMIKKNRDLINTQIGMQGEDAERDAVQTAMLDNAIGQRKDIKDGVDANTGLLGDVKGNQAVMMGNQKKMSHKLDHINAGVNSVQDRVDKNGLSMAAMHDKMNAHDAAFVIHAAHLEKHMDDHAVHDAKQDALIDMHKEHDAKQTEMMGQVMVNQGKLNDLKNGQAKTQGMIATHDANMKAHAENMNDFKAKQFSFNGEVAHHMKDEDAHMEKENKHMKMEALHMADAEHHHNLHDHHRHFRHHIVRPKVVLVKKAAPSFLVGESNQ